MSRVRLLAAALSASFCSAVLGASAEAQVRGTIFGPGTRQYPIAVSEAKNLAGISAQTISLLADVISRDLEIAGLFRPVPRSAYIERPDT
jgi:Tol biopolymer transport system component